jgi:hypothetical protein
MTSFPMTTAFIILSILSQGGLAENPSALCSSEGQPLVMITEALKLDFNVVHEFDASTEIIHEGHNSLIKKIQLSDESAVVVKRVNRVYNHMEYQVRKMVVLNKFEFFTKIYACVQSVNFMYVVMEFVDGRSFADEILKHEMKNLGGGAPLLAFLMPAFNLIDEMNASYLVHGDITPQHMMKKPSGELKILGMDFVVHLDERSFKVARESFFSPTTKVTNSIKGRLDDLYSLIMSIAVCLTSEIELLYLNHFDIFSETKVQIMLNPNTNDPKTKGVINDRLKTIFSSVGFGEYESDRKLTNVNLTTVFADVHELDDLRFSFDEIIDIVRRTALQNGIHKEIVNPPSQRKRVEEAVSKHPIIDAGGKMTDLVNYDHGLDEEWWKVDLDNFNSDLVEDDEIDFTIKEIEPYSEYNDALYGYNPNESTGYIQHNSQDLLGSGLDHKRQSKIPSNGPTGRIGSQAQDEAKLTVEIIKDYSAGKHPSNDKTPLSYLNPAEIRPDKRKTGNRLAYILKPIELSSNHSQRLII